MVNYISTEPRTADLSILMTFSSRDNMLVFLIPFFEVHPNTLIPNVVFLSIWPAVASLIYFGLKKVSALFTALLCHRSDV